MVFLPGAWTSAASEGPESVQSCIEPLLLQLNSDDFQEREDSTATLRGLGTQAHAALRDARARAEDPEMEGLLDDILCGPTIDGLRVTRWVKAIQEDAGGQGLLPLRALERAGLGALPHALALLDPSNRSALLQGLWVLARLGPLARCARPAVFKLLEDELERVNRMGPPGMEEIARLERQSPLYLFPYSTQGSDPPAAVFYLQRSESASTDLGEIVYWRLNARARETSSFRLIPYHYPEPSEMDSLFWGSLQFMERCRRAKILDAELSPALYLTVLCRALERIGPDAEIQATLEKASRLSISLQRQEEENHARSVDCATER